MMDGRKCNICNKMYSSYKSLWNHNKKYHTIIPMKNPQKSTILSQNSTILPQKSTLNCVYCDKKLSRIDSLKRHEQICKNKDDINKDNIIEGLQKDFLELKNKFNDVLQNCKIHPKTLQKINKQLINNVINNGTINNTVNIVKFGSEDLADIFTEKEMIKIYNRKMCSIEESIKTLHFNDNRPEYKNMYITNLKDPYAYIFDGTHFIAIPKDDLLEELINNHFENIECSLDDYIEKLDAKTVIVVKKFISMMNSDEITFMDKQHKKIYPDFKTFNKKHVKLMIYNKTDKKAHILIYNNELVV